MPLCFPSSTPMKRRKTVELLLAKIFGNGLRCIYTIYVKNITLQIKNKKHIFFYFYKNIKTCIKTINYSIHSSKKHRQYESNKVNTATKHSLCPGNGVFAHEKCIMFVILYVFVLTTTKTRH